MLADQIDPALDMAVRPNQIGADIVHLGEASPGDDSQSFMCEAVSACRARRESNSRALLPGGCFSAASLKSRASSARRSAKVVWCFVRFRIWPMAHSPKTLTAGSKRIPLSSVCPVPDISNQSTVVAETLGFRCGRFTWRKPAQKLEV
jgi:hypothetical protein